MNLSYVIIFNISEYTPVISNVKLVQNLLPSVVIQSIIEITIPEMPEGKHGRPNRLSL